MTDDSRKPAEIERDIEAERARLSRDLDLLQDRLTVDGLMDEVRIQVRAQIDDLQRGLRSQVAEVTGVVSGELRGQLTRASAGLTRTARENPLPAAVAGLALGWLALSALRPKPRRNVGYAPVKSTPVADRPIYDSSPADMAARQLENDADRWARDHVDASANPIPPYDPRPTWARDDDELTTSRP